MKSLARALFLVALIGWEGTVLEAQEEQAGEPRLEELIRHSQTRPLTLGMLLQVVGNQGLAWFAGLFSGPRNLSTNDALLAAARLESRTSIGERNDRLIVGANGGYGRNDGLARAFLLEEFRGDGWVAGADARYTFGRGLLAGELLATTLRPDDGEGERTVWGHHLTGGWVWTPTRQLLVRWDRFDGLDASPDDAVLLGLNVWPTGATEVQVNHVVPVPGEVSRHQLLRNVQPGF